jgi:hypothetical protein
MDAESFDWHAAGLTVGQVAARSGVAPCITRASSGLAAN